MLGLTVLTVVSFVALPWLARQFFSGPGRARTVRYMFMLATLLGMGVLAEVVGIESIVGAFFAGLGLNRLVPNEGEFMERIEFFGSARMGATALTHEHVSWDDVTLYPEMGFLGQLELGLRGPRLFLSGYFEAMTWGESDVVRECWQPRSAMITVGLRSGFRF